MKYNRLKSIYVLLVVMIILVKLVMQVVMSLLINKIPIVLIYGVGMAVGFLFLLPTAKILFNFFKWVPPGISGAKYSIYWKKIVPHIENSAIIELREKYPEYSGVVLSYYHRGLLYKATYDVLKGDEKTIIKSNTFILDGDFLKFMGIKHGNNSVGSGLKKCFNYLHWKIWLNGHHIPAGGKLGSAERKLQKGPYQATLKVEDLKDWFILCDLEFVNEKFVEWKAVSNKQKKECLLSSTS